MTEHLTGQQAYEADCAIAPNYHDGKPRKTWDELSEVARLSWELNPTVQSPPSRLSQLSIRYRGKPP